jgi:hypothetical protein
MNSVIWKADMMMIETRGQDEEGNPTMDAE